MIVVSFVGVGFLALTFIDVPSLQALTEQHYILLEK